MTLLCCKESQNKVMSPREKDEMQLLGVSREARKLSQMINSLPKVPHLHARPALVGIDLVKGALDLQDPLIALGKCQPMNGLSQTKSAQHTDGEPINNEQGESSQRSPNKNTDALLSKNCRNSISQRSCIEELKEAIKDSLCRQSFLTISSYDCEASFGRSLSFNTITRRNSFRLIEPRKGSNASLRQDMKTRSPNLIPKLMGLEDIPVETIQPIKMKNESNRSSDSRRLAPKIVRKSERKQTLLKQKPKPKLGTAQDITEKGQTNACGIMSDTFLPDLRRKRSQVKEECRWPMNSKTLYCTKRKKFQEQLLSDKIAKEKVIRSDELVSDRNVLPLEVDDILFGSTEKTLMTISPRNKEDHAMVNSKAMAYFGEWSQEACKVRTLLKQEVEQPVGVAHECIRVDDEHGIRRKRSRIAVRRLEKNKVESSTKIQKSCNLCHKPNQKKAVASYEQQKSGVHEISAKPDEHKVKPVQLSLMKTDKKMASAISDKGKTTAERTVTRQVEAQTNSTARNFRVPAKRSMIEPTKISISMKFPKQKDGKTMSTSCKTDASIGNTVPSAQHPKQRMHRLEPSGAGKLRRGQKVINEVMPKISKIRNADKLQKTTVQLSYNKGSIADIPGVDFKGLLLNSGLFLVHAFEHRNHSHRDVHDEVKELHEDGSTELYLSCADELLARRSYHLELSKHLMSNSNLRKLSVCPLPDRLVEIINEGLITLTNYSRVSDDAIASHVLYIMLEKDLKCKDSMLNAMWDVGWWNSICLEEADLLVGQLEEDILFYLVVEVAIGLLQSH